MASLSKMLKSALAETPLVQNLNNGEYLEIILKGCSSLAERFSQIDAHLVQKEMKNVKNSYQRFYPQLRKLYEILI
jgi:D-serine dehydratase